MPGPIETKVKAAGAVGLLVGLVVTLLNAIVADSALLGSLPPLAQVLITLFGPPLAVLLGGYAAPHTPRTDPAARAAADVAPWTRE